MTKYQDLRDGHAPGRLARGDISADRGHGRAEIGRMCKVVHQCRVSVKSP
jgi:hypothetical protein